MKLRPIVLALVALFLISSCAQQEMVKPATGAWVGTITTEGNVTTVVNESGSVWGGTARLVEEASIGVEAGAEEYMFGRISSIYATDARIYVADSQVPAVRAYDHAGAFVGNFGRSGQGPGEYMRPNSVAGDETGRVFVFDTRLARINVYASSGEVLGAWPLPTPYFRAWPIYPLSDEAVWAPLIEWVDRERDEFRWGVQAVGPSGPYGEVTWSPELEFVVTIYQVDENFEERTPFSAWLLFNPAPHGGIVAGASDRYRFEVHERDGSRLVVERTWQPVPVPVEQKEWERRREVAFQRGSNNPDFTWDGSEIPDHKPAYDALIPSLSGQTWVIREGPSKRLTNCVENPITEGLRAAYERPCWGAERIVDVFDADGRYLGEVQVPDGISGEALRFSVNDRRIVAVVQDPEGTIMVKRYRLVLPGDEAR